MQMCLIHLHCFPLGDVTMADHVSRLNRLFIFSHYVSIKEDNAMSSPLRYHRSQLSFKYMLR